MRRLRLIVLMMLVIICIMACQDKQNEQVVLGEIESAQTENASEEADSIYVYVCGAVNCEGVYELPVGSRTYEAIALAGGFREDAATKEVNQAEILEDESRIYIPTIAETVDSQEENDGKININKATKEELMTLPGVGESRAESIIQYRKEVGAFQSIEDIMQISGIKSGLFEKIKDLIKV